MFKYINFSTIKWKKKLRQKHHDMSCCLLLNYIWRNAVYLWGHYKYCNCCNCNCTVIVNAMESPWTPFLVTLNGPWKEVILITHNNCIKWLHLTEKLWYVAKRLTQITIFNKTFLSRSLTYKAAPLFGNI